MPTDDLIGQILGQYELRDLLGSGGMGSVYRAYQASLKREVALKVLSSTLASQPGYADRFNREAETAASLEHAHIIPIHDYGIQRGTAYIVMRWMTGGTLAQRLSIQSGEEQKLPSLGEISDLLAQLASAMDYAHSRGVVHRDIKPANIMFDNQGNAYLADFGIAKLVNLTSSMTATGYSMGTPSYMAPEQWRADTVVPATDQYALGVMTYMLMTGKLPFEASTPYALMHKHLNEQPTPPESWRPELPSALGIVIERALAKEPDDRFPTVTAFAQAFTAATQGNVGQHTNIFRFPLRGKANPLASPGSRSTPISGTPVPPIGTPSLVTGTSQIPRGVPIPLLIVIVLIAVLGTALIVSRQSAPTVSILPTVPSVIAQVATRTAIPVSTYTLILNTSTAVPTAEQTKTSIPIIDLPSSPTSTPTPTAILPTSTPIPPTPTAILPTSTPIPPTLTPFPPTNTAIPPTVTLPPSTDTPISPTNTITPKVTLLVWIVGSVYQSDCCKAWQDDTVIPPSTLPDNLLVATNQLNLNLDVQEFPAKNFAQVFFAVAGTNHAPDILIAQDIFSLDGGNAGNTTYVGIKSRQDVKKNAINVIGGAFSSLGEVIMFSNSPHFTESKELALDTSCDPQYQANLYSLPNDLKQQIAIQSISAAMAYVKHDLKTLQQLGGTTYNKDIANEFPYEPTEVPYDSKICGIWGNQQIVFSDIRIAINNSNLIGTRDYVAFFLADSNSSLKLVGLGYSPNVIADLFQAAPQLSLTSTPNTLKKPVLISPTNGSTSNNRFPPPNAIWQNAGDRVVLYILEYEIKTPISSRGPYVWECCSYKVILPQSSDTITGSPPAEGAQPFRWHIIAVDDSGNTTMSDWWTITYTQ